MCVGEYRTRFDFTQRMSTRSNGLQNQKTGRAETSRLEVLCFLFFGGDEVGSWADFCEETLLVLRRGGERLFVWATCVQAREVWMWIGGGGGGIWYIGLGVVFLEEAGAEQSTGCVAT